MKQISIHHLLLSVLFMVFISLPLGIAFISVDESVSQTEKRKLAELPAIDFSLTSLEEFPTAFDSYFGDHFGFRQQIVRTHNYILVKMFGVSPTGLVIIGTNDWYFFTGDSAIKDYLGGRQLGSRKLASIYYLLQDRKYWLNSRGAEYMFLPLPNKEMIYDEFLPAHIRQHRGETIYRRVVNYLQEKEGFQDFIDVEQLMLKNKEKKQLFLRTDSHWNHDGVFLTYQEIMNRIGHWYPDMVPIPKRSERKMIYDFSGDLTVLMNLQGLITEDAPDVIVDTVCSPRALERMDEIKKIPKYQDLELHRLPVQSGCKEQTYKAVVFHDSFGRFLRPYLSQQFETVIYINHFDLEHAKAIIEREKPDVVIDQRVARNLLKALRNDHELQQDVLKERFDDLTEVRTELDNNHLLQAAVMNGDGSLTMSGNNLEFVVESKESAVIVTMDKADHSSDPSVFRVDLDSSQDTRVILCYREKPAINPLHPQCLRREVAEGENSLFFRMLEPGSGGTLEINPVTPGKYRIRSIVAKKETI